MISSVVLGQIVEDVLIVGDVCLHVVQVIERVTVLITAAIEQMVGGFAFFVFTFAKEEGCTVGQSVVELLKGVSGHGVRCRSV